MDENNFYLLIEGSLAISNLFHYIYAKYILNLTRSLKISKCWIIIYKKLVTIEFINVENMSEYFKDSDNFVDQQSFYFALGKLLKLSQNGSQNTVLWIASEFPNTLCDLNDIFCKIYQNDRYAWNIIMTDNFELYKNVFYEEIQKCITFDKRCEDFNKYDGFWSYTPSLPNFIELYFNASTYESIPAIPKTEKNPIMNELISLEQNIPIATTTLSYTSNTQPTTYSNQPSQSGVAFNPIKEEYFEDTIHAETTSSSVITAESFIPPDVGFPSNSTVKDTSQMASSTALTPNFSGIPVMGPGPQSSVYGLQPNATPIWSGLLQWNEKMRSAPQLNTNSQDTSGPNAAINVITHSLMCQIYPMPGFEELNANAWPQTLIMQAIQQDIIHKLGNMFRNAKTVIMQFPNQEVTASYHALNRLLTSNMAGCIMFPSNIPDLRVMILLYSLKKKAFIGLIPLDQTEFVGNIKKILSYRKQMQQQTQQNQNQPPPPALSSSNNSAMGPSLIPNSNTMTSNVLGGQQNLTLNNPQTQNVPGTSMNMPLSAPYTTQAYNPNVNSNFGNFNSPYQQNSNLPPHMLQQPPNTYPNYAANYGQQNFGQTPVTSNLMGYDSGSQYNAPQPTNFYNRNASMINVNQPPLQNVQSNQTPYGYNPPPSVQNMNQLPYGATNLGMRQPTIPQPYQQPQLRNLLLSSQNPMPDSKKQE